MAVMVPDIIDEFTRRRFEAKRCVWTELRDQLPDDHTVFTVTGRAFGPVDFVVLTPGGLVFVAAEGGIVDVLAPPQPGIEWTHRGPDGYFIGAIRPEGLSEGARTIGGRLLPCLPAAFHRAAAEFGAGLLYVFPDSQANHAPGIDMASAQRQVLVSSDLGRIGEWVERAAQARPASPGLSPELRRQLAQALTTLVLSNSPLPAFLRQGLQWRHAVLAVGAVTILAAALLAGEIRSAKPPMATAAYAVPAGENPANPPLPDFVPAGAEWAVLGAIEVAADSPGRAVKWRHADITGTVTLLADGGKCRTYRIIQGNAAADRRICS